MPSTQTFEDFFAGVRMTQLAAAASVKGPGPRVLPDAFYMPGPTKPYNDQVQYASVTWSRAGATVINRNSPPRAINLGNTQWQFATIFNMKEEMEIDPNFLGTLFSDVPLIRDGAMRELNRRMIMFNRRTDTTRANMVHSLFANGKVWIGSDGQVLATSSGAVMTLDPGIPTGNKITKDGAGSTFNIGDWSQAATDISGKLRTLQETAIRQSGQMLKNIIYGTSIPTYLANNTSLNPFFVRNPTFRESLVLTNDIPSGFLGYNWIPARLSYLEKADGTTSATFASNSVTVTPDPDPEWYEAVEGGTLTPAGVAGGVEVNAGATTLQSYASEFRIAYGKYGYGVKKTHPVVGWSMVQGDVFGPVLKVPTAVYFGTVS